MGSVIFNHYWLYRIRLLPVFMKGIQLFTGNLKEQVSEPFHINTIPRFVLIGRDGKLINGDAPRPSSEEIRPLINYHLKKK